MLCCVCKPGSDEGVGVSQDGPAGHGARGLVGPALAAGAGVTVARAAPPKKEIVSHSHPKTRTSERWMAGEPIRELQWPLRGTLESALEGSGRRSQAPENFQG